MSGNFDIITIIFLVLAVFIVIKLKSVLGTKTGEERDTFTPRMQPPAQQPPVRADAPANNVIPMPQTNAAPPAYRWTGIAPEGSDLARGLDAVAAKDPSFDARGFVNGARGAYEMIVMAFAHGDRATLKNLLAPDVYEGFEAAIADREQKGEVVDQRFVGIDKAEIIDADVHGRMVHVAVKFNAQMFSSTRNKAGEVVSGDPSRVTAMNDAWTFARDPNSSDPNWKLVATSAAA